MFHPRGAAGNGTRRTFANSLTAARRGRAAATASSPLFAERRDRWRRARYLAYSRRPKRHDTRARGICRLAVPDANRTSALLRKIGSGAAN
jgi:hypothetical protein